MNKSNRTLSPPQNLYCEGNLPKEIKLVDDLTVLENVTVQV